MDKERIKQTLVVAPIEYIRGMKTGKKVALAFALLILAKSGISLFHTPSEEVVWDSTRHVVKSTEDNTWLVIQTVEVGNTGSKAQSNVMLHFSADAIAHAIMPPYAKTFGVSHRSITSMTQDDGRISYNLGPMDSEMRVSLYLAMRYAETSRLPQAAESFLGAEPHSGTSRHGNPGMTVVGRALFSVFTDWWPF